MNDARTLVAMSTHQMHELIELVNLIGVFAKIEDDDGPNIDRTMSFWNQIRAQHREWLIVMGGERDA